ncbi:hypothetical protein M3Y99_00720700 [Aphelenchoides fujianensis]|nr:hypothetical protein M3Y99_00720700 [Aphelenchoides fujianensis]
MFALHGRWSSFSFRFFPFVLLVIEGMAVDPVTSYNYRRPFRVTREFQLRVFGWVLLLIWISSIVYMTRHFWFPRRCFGLAPLKTPAYSSSFSSSSSAGKSPLLVVVHQPSTPLSTSSSSSPSSSSILTAGHERR